MRTGFIVTTWLLAAASVAAATTAKKESKRLTEAAAVVRELRGAPDGGIPQSIWDRARCVAVMPGVKKAAFILGGETGSGVVSCRTAHGWSAPVFVKLERESVGVQFGAESTDIVLVIINDRGVERLLQDKVTLGADVSISTGPVGRSGTPATDAHLTAEMVSYSRSRGLFAGIDLSGGVLRPDTDATQQFYGHGVADREILLGTTSQRVPAAANRFIEVLSAAPRVVANRRN
jgi:lipid-binding SYLF domain-containing protein